MVTEVSVSLQRHTMSWCVVPVLRRQRLRAHLMFKASYNNEDGLIIHCVPSGYLGVMASAL